MLATSHAPARDPHAQPPAAGTAAGWLKREEAIMYKNFYSAQAATVLGAPTESRLLLKPLVQNVLHGGGIVFDSVDDPNAKVIAFWISRPVPAGHDEFSTSANSLFTPPDPINGTCNTQ